jgi:dienelactone hydrolase
VHKSGDTAKDYWLFTPANPVPAKAPVVIFNHGWSCIEPSNYLGWIIHLARKGNIVIYPRWQVKAGAMNGSEFLPNATTAVKRALKRLTDYGPCQADRQQVAVMGHSIGGTLSADMAATAATYNIPQAKAVFSVEPGTISTATGVPHGDDVTVADFSKIPAGVLLVALVGEDDEVVPDTMARRIHDESTAIGTVNKDYLIVRTDNHGSPVLEADHEFPLAAGDRSNCNALDYYALWKIGDALEDAAFRGTHRAYCLGNTAKQRYMGKWADGVQVKQLTVQ